MNAPENSTLSFGQATTPKKTAKLSICPTRFLETEIFRLLETY